MSSIKSNYFYNTLYQILGLVVPMVTTPYLTRILLASNLGEYAYLISITSYFTMFIALGVANYGNRIIAENRNDKNRLSKIFLELFSLQLFIGVFVLLIYFFFIIQYSNPVLLFLFSINIISSILDISWALQGLELFKLIAVRNTVIRLLTTLAIFGFVKESEDFFIYCIIMLSGNLVAQLISWPIVIKRINYVKIDIKGIVKHLRPNLYLFIPVCSTVIYKSIDKLMLGYYNIDKSQVGYYELSERIIAIPNLLVTSLGTVMMPRVSHLIANKDNSFLDYIPISCLLAMIISSSMGFGIMAVSKEFIPIFYGNGYEVCTDLYLILLPCSFFMAFANVLRTQYIVPNHMDSCLVKISCYGVVFNIILNSFLIPKYNAIGAAIGTLLAEIFACVAQSIVVAKQLPVFYYLRLTLPIVCNGFFMFMIVFYVDFHLIDWQQLAIKIILGFGIYILGLFICCQNKTYKNLIKCLFAGIGITKSINEVH